MSVSLLLQYVVIALAVLVSVFVVVRKYLPGTWGVSVVYWVGI